MSKKTSNDNEKNPGQNESGVVPVGNTQAETVGAELDGGASNKGPEVVQGVDIKTGKPVDKDTIKTEGEQIELNPGPSNPTIVKSAEDEEHETAASKAKRAKKAAEAGEIDRTSEKTAVHKNKDGNVAMVMTNVDNEKLMVTPKQWDKYGKTLIANGWVRPAWAENDGGSETIPANIDWGVDTP